VEKEWKKSGKRAEKEFPGGEGLRRTSISPLKND